MARRTNSLTQEQIDALRASLSGGLDESLSGSTGGLTFGGSSGSGDASIGWADMTPIQRMAHSIKNGTDYQNTVNDPELYAAALRYLEQDPFPGVSNSGDALAELYAMENTQAQAQEQAASNDYGFSNAQQSSYDQLMASGVVNPDGTLNTEGMTKQQLYDLYTGGFGLGETDAHDQLIQQAFEAFASMPSPEGQITVPGSSDGLTFGGGSVVRGEDGGSTDGSVDDTVVDDTVVDDTVVDDTVVDDTVVDDTVVDNGPSDPFNNAYFDIGRSGVYEAGIYDSPNTEGYIQSFLTNKTWDEMTPQEQAAHAIMRGELSYYNTIDPEVYQAGIDLLQSETGDLMSNMGWYSRLEAIDRIRDREAEGITQGVSLADALRRAGFQDIEGYDTFIDMVNQGLVDWDGDLNLESSRWNEWLLDDYNASRFTDLNNADLANYMYNQLGNIDLGVDVVGGPGSGPNGPLDDPDNPPWGWDGGYDWNWGDFQNGAPSLDGGGGYDPNEYAFDRYVPGQESPWGVPEVEGGNKDFYRNQFVNLLKDEQNFQNKQDASRRNRWLIDRAQAGVQEAPGSMTQENWENNWLRPNQPVAMDWSWIDGGLPEVQIGGDVDWQRNTQYEGTNSDILRQLMQAGEINQNTYRWFQNTWRDGQGADSNWWQNTATYDRLNSMGDNPAGQAAYRDVADSLFTNYGTAEGVAAGYAAPVQGYNPRRLQSGPANQYFTNGGWLNIGQIAG